MKKIKLYKFFIIIITNEIINYILSYFLKDNKTIINNN